MRQRYPRHRCTFDQGLFDDPPLLLDWAVLPLGSGSALAFDCDEFCGLRGSVHLRSKWARSICVSTKNKDVLLSPLCPDGYQRTLTKNTNNLFSDLRSQILPFPGRQRAFPDREHKTSADLRVLCWKERCLS